MSTVTNEILGPPPFDVWVVISRVGDVAGLIATAVALTGLAYALLVRPRLNVFAEHQGGDRLLVFVWHQSGAAPAHNVCWRWASLLGDGRALAAESGGTWGVSPSTVLSGEYRHIEFTDGPTSTLPGFTSVHHVQVPLPYGVLCEVSWQRPLLPWLRARSVIRWSQEDRAAGRGPVRLVGRRARDELATAFPHTPPRIPPIQTL